MTADLNLLRKREELLAARIESTQDPFLRDNLVRDLQNVSAHISSLLESAA